MDNFILNIYLSILNEIHPTPLTPTPLSKKEFPAY
jgi:hypothetical protein